MRPNSQVPEAAFAFINKVFSYEDGALAVIAVPLSSGFTELLKLIIGDVPQKDFVMPLLAASLTLVMYLVLFTGDFLTGMRAARHESQTKDFVESSKLWRSFWKLCGVFMILTTILVFCILCAFLELQFWYTFFLYAIPTIMLMVILFELHSIGENIKRRFGRKPSYFNFFDKITEIVEKGIIEKLKKLWN